MTPTAHALPALALAGLASLTAISPATAQPALDGDALQGLRWRSIGPVNFGGRIVDIDVDPTAPATWYVATGSGGLWKTDNAGTTFRPVFDDTGQFSIGAVTLAPSAPRTVWVGTGEANNQRSSYWGDGVYRSIDGGESWTHCGLRHSEHIGRIAVHPTNPEVVYVATLGALYTDSEQRGLYRSTDGGAHWQAVLQPGPSVGCVDVVIDPHDPDTVYAATYERRRRAHHFDPAGPGSAIHKSTDGGDSWTRLEGGLPEGALGRIGLALFAGDPDIVYAVVENADPAAMLAARSGRGRRASRRDPDSGTGEVYRSDDGGDNWTKVNERPVGGTPGYYYGQIVVDPTDADTVYVLSVPVHKTTDGGKTWSTDFGRGLHVDHHALWIDPQHPNHALLGNDGGLAETWDSGAHWDTFNHLPIGQFYAVGVDLRTPYRVYGGLQDNGTWSVPSRSTTTRPIGPDAAVRVGGGDGFYAVIDPREPDVVYSESQFGGMSRQNLRTGERRSIKPRAERGQATLRFNWMTPIVISPHNTETVYVGSQFVHRSRNRGDDWQTISPDLSTGDAARIAGNVPHCTITTLAESTLRPGLLWAGTDDGKVWVSRTGGRRWVDLTERFEGMPMPLWVSRIEPSHADEDVAYVAFTGYREDLRAPFLYLTTDGGESFRPIHNDLPPACINVIREHPRNPDCLLVGHEAGVHVSLDGGRHWLPLGAGMPPAPVHDLVVHPREEDAIAATHGRGFYICDITPLAEFGRAATAGLHVFEPRPGVRLGHEFSRGYTGARTWRAEEPSAGAVFHYWLGSDGDAVQLAVLDADGEVIYEREGAGSAGLHQERWPRSNRRTARLDPGQYLLRVRRGDDEVRHGFWIR